MALKILIKRKFKSGNKRAASRLLINNRNGAMKQSGYISSEGWRNLDDTDQVVVVSMWENIDAWETWKNNGIRKFLKKGEQ
jgi:heme-degrading monooxygenase HmoA